MSNDNGRLRLTLRVSGPVVEDIMVFGAAPCSAGRRKCRNAAYLGLLPAPVGGESDITKLYVARYGEPEPGKRVFIRTRQQKNGWEDHNQDTCEVVPAKPVAAAQPGGGQIRTPNAELRRKSETRNPNAAWSGGLLRSLERLMHKGCTRELHRSSSQVSRLQCRRGTGVKGGMRRAECRMRTGGEARGRRKAHWRELWHGS
jgi:hypothetical protein